MFSLWTVSGRCDEPLASFGNTTTVIATSIAQGMTVA